MIFVGMVLIIIGINVLGILAEEGYSFNSNLGGACVAIGVLGALLIIIDVLTPYVEDTKEIHTTSDYKSIGAACGVWKYGKTTYKPVIPGAIVRRKSPKITIVSQVRNCEELNKFMED